jgi:hypothetical protein
MTIHCRTTGLSSLTTCATILEAMRDLAQCGNFSRNTRCIAPAGTGILTTLWKALGTQAPSRPPACLLDRGAAVSKSTVHTVTGKHVSTTAHDDVQKKPAKQRPTTAITEETVTTDDTNRISSLSPVQATERCNQAFVINAPTCNPSVDGWENPFENPLRTLTAAMVRTNRNTNPEDFTAYDIISRAGDIPGDVDPTA